MAAIGPLYSPARRHHLMPPKCPNLGPDHSTGCHPYKRINTPCSFFLLYPLQHPLVQCPFHPLIKSSIFPSYTLPSYFSPVRSFLPSAPLSSCSSQFPRYRLSVFANSTPPSILADFLFPRQCLKPRPNPQRLPRRLRKHTPHTSNLNCLSFLLYPFHIQTRPTSISTHKPAAGISFVSRSSAATPLT